MATALAGASACSICQAASLSSRHQSSQVSGASVLHQQQDTRLSSTCSVGIVTLVPTLTYPMQGPARPTPLPASQLDSEKLYVPHAGSSQANPFACIASGIAALWGPAHGGANEAVLRMLEEIGSPDKVHEAIAKAKVCC